MGAKGSVEAAKLNADNWGHLEVCTVLFIQESKQTKYNKQTNKQKTNANIKPCVCMCVFMFILAQLSIFLPLFDYPSLGISSNVWLVYLLWILSY